MRRKMRLPPVRELTKEEGQELLERLTQEHFGMGLEEFKEKWRAGCFDPEDPDALWIAFLLPLAE